MTERPDFADTLNGQIILEMVGSGKTLKLACETVGQSYSDVFRKIIENPKFKERMEEARAAGYEVIAEECVEIARTGTLNDDGKPSKDYTQRAKLMIETNLKLLAKWHPKKYGEKLEIEQKTATVAIPVGDDPIAAQQAYERLMKGG